MSSLLIPPPGLFPGAITFITPAMLPRFQAILAYQVMASTAGNGTCLGITPGCSAPVTGESFHIWKTAVPEDEWYRICAGCGPATCNPNQAWISPGLGQNWTVSATIGDGNLLTLHDLATILIASTIPAPAIAIRWATLFTTLSLTQLTRSTSIIHFLGNP